jgi:pimeloyl-ACP methyl ester carboxylesterase
LSGDCEAINYGYAQTKAGTVHYAECGAGSPVLCLHQTPRSVNEFLELMPLLGTHHRVIAMDTPGMGGSPASAAGASIEAYASAALALLDHMAIDSASVIGHHTGGVIAFRLAAIAPWRVNSLVLSSTPFVDAQGRDLRKRRPPIDEVAPSEDGSHLSALWQKRMPFYPPNRPDLLARFVRDAMRAGDPEEGHRAVARYEMENDLSSVAARTLIVAHREDPFAYPETDTIHAAIPDAQRVELPHGMVPLEYCATEFAELVLPFLAE